MEVSRSFLTRGYSALKTRGKNSRKLYRKILQSLVKYIKGGILHTELICLLASLQLFNSKILNSGLCLVVCLAVVNNITNYFMLYLYEYLLISIFYCISIVLNYSTEREVKFGPHNDCLCCCR